MALYHQTIKVISRGKGQSGVAGLAYRSGTELSDQHTGEVSDYSNKSVLAVEFVLPENAPEFFRKWSRDVEIDKQCVMQEFSNYVESFEKRKDSQIYRESEFALQRELSDETNMELARRFAKECFAAHGMVGVLNFHKDLDKKTGLEKLHCHALFLTRHIDENGLGLKNRAWNSKNFHEMWREKWAEIVNEKFAELGIDKRIDHRSLEEQGLSLKPLPKLGMAAVSKMKRGVDSIRYKLFEDAKRHNLFLIQQRPEYALEVITRGQSTFTRDDVIQLVGRYADTHEIFSSLVERIMASREIVHIDGKDRGAVYTTCSQLRLEHDLVEKSEILSNKTSHEVRDDFITKALSHFNEKLKDRGGLSQDQRQAIRHITAPGQLKVIVGYAGAGKTTALEAAKDAWQAQGYRVIGLAPTGKASRNLEDIGITSFTVDKFEKAFKAGRFQYNKNTVFILDEAGMLDVRRMQLVLQIVEKMACKLVLVGDGAQLQPIQSGPALRMLLNKIDPVKLEHVVRQRQEWQQTATVFFGQERTRDALELYQRNDCIKLVKEQLPGLDKDISDKALVRLGSTAKRMAGSYWHKMREDLLLKGVKEENIRNAIYKHRDIEVFKNWQTIRDTCLGLMKERGLTLNKDMVDLRASTRQAMVKDWIQDRVSNPEASHIMLANSNKDVIALNVIARGELRKLGVISREETLLRVRIEEDLGLDRKKTKHEKVGFSIGDQVIFKSNDSGLKVSNGDLGTILSLQKDKVQVQLHGSDKRVVSFSTNLYPNIQHGWAATIFASQGSTYDYVKQLASFELYRNLAYVGTTRHRVDCKIYGSSMEFNNTDILIDRLSSSREKLATTDYVKTSEELERLILEENRFLEKAERSYLRVKEGTRAVSHFVKGLFKDREELEVNTYGNKSEAERALKRLGLISTSSSYDKAEAASIPAHMLAQDKNKDLDLSSSTQVLAQVSRAAAIPSAARDVLYYDLDKIKAVLESDGEKLVSKLLAATPNRAMSNTRELRYGKKGSFVLTTVGARAGKWHDFETGEGGNLFTLVGRELKLNEFKDQLEYVASFYGLSSDKKMLDKYDLQAVKSKDLEGSSRIDVVDQKKLEHIEKAYNISQPVEGTLAERYLREHRKIEGDLPGSIRFIPSYGQDKLPALAVFATDVQGQRTGMQLTYLNPETAQKAALDINKRSYGKVGGSAVEIQKGNGPVFIAEGIETALSIASVAPKNASVLAALGVSNFKNITVTRDQQIIICADNDSHKAPVEGKDKSPSEIAVEKAVKHLEEQGVKVTVVMPEKAGQDFNDVLKNEGTKGISTYIENVLRQVASQDLNKEDVASTLSVPSRLEDQLKGYLLDQLKSSHKEQPDKEVTQIFLGSKKEEISLASNYLKISSLEIESSDLNLRLKASLARASHEIKVTPSRIENYVTRLDENDSSNEALLLNAHLKGQRLACIEGRLVEEAILKDGRTKSEENILRDAKQEVFENNRLLPELEAKYTSVGINPHLTKEIASICIHSKELHGKLPDDSSLDNIKDIAKHVSDRRMEIMKGQEIDQDLLKSRADYICSREGINLLKMGELKTLSGQQLRDIQFEASKDANVASKAALEAQRREERNISKDIELER